MALVSVVMAAKNYARFLPTAVESVIAQTFAGWELVVVDDGSTDATPAAVKPFLSDPRIHYHRSDVLGQSRAKNLGIRLSRGQFVAFLDADDAWHPTKLAKQLPLFYKPTVGVVYCRRSLIDEAGNALPPRPRTPLPRGRVLAEMFAYNFVCFSSVVVRRTVFDHVGAFDPTWDLAIDYELWLRVAAQYGFDLVDEELVLYRTGHGNLSAKLADRVSAAEAMMTQALERRGLAGHLPNDVIAEGYASTFRTLAYSLRPSEPLSAATWYWRALRYGGNRTVAAKGLVASALRWASGRRAAGTPENAGVNR